MYSLVVGVVSCRSLSSIRCSSCNFRRVRVYVDPNLSTESMRRLLGALIPLPRGITRHSLQLTSKHKCIPWVKLASVCSVEDMIAAARYTPSGGRRHNTTSVQESDVRDVIIIGSGQAGYTAALYTARAQMRPLMIAGIQHGGQVSALCPHRYSMLYVQAFVTFVCMFRLMLLGSNVQKYLVLCSIQ